MTGEIEELSRLFLPMLSGTPASRREALRLLGNILPLHVHAEENPDSEPATSLFIPGDTDKTVLLLAPVPKPCLAGNNLSGILLTAFLARELLRRRTRFSYLALLLPPGTENKLPELAAAHGGEMFAAAVIRETAGPGPWTFATHEPHHGLFFLLTDVFKRFDIAREHRPWRDGDSPERFLAEAFPDLPSFALRKEPEKARARSATLASALGARRDHPDADALSRTLLLHLGVLERLEDDPSIL